MIPRFRGRVGEGEDGKFYFELEMGTLGGGENFESFGQFGPFETEAIAQTKLREACAVAVEAIQVKVQGYATGAYYDMKDNKTKMF